MTKKNNMKSFTILIDKDCWKRLKILSIEKDCTLQGFVRDILEKKTLKKGQEIENNIEE